MTLKALMVSLALFSIQGCLFFDDNEPEPMVFSGAQLKGLVPALRTDSGTEAIGARGYRLSYPVCDLDSSEAYANARISEGWTKGATSSFNIYGVGALYKQTVSKTISGRTISLNVRCSHGYEGKYSSSLYLSN